MKTKASIYAVLCLLLAVCTLRAEAATPQRPLLDRKPLKETILADYAQGEAGAQAEHPKASATAKDGRLQVALPARVQDPLVVLSPVSDGALADADVLRFDITLEGEARVATRILLRAGDGKAAVYPARLDPGANIVAVPLWRLYVGKKPLARADIRSVCLTVDRLAKPTSLTVGPLRAQVLFEDGVAGRFFDFGDEAVFPGAAPVAQTTTYEKNVGYGLLGTQRIARAFQSAIPLLGDLVQGKDLAFRVDLPDGEYEVQAVAFGVNWQGVRNESYKIWAGDKVAVDEVITAEKFFSYDGQYYGANIFYDPSRTLFDQYHRAYFKPHVFDATAEGGMLTLRFEGCGARALWIYPKAKADEGQAFVQACLGEVDHRLWSTTAKVRAHAPNAEATPPVEADVQRGYRLFARNASFRIYPNYEPSAKDALPAEGLNMAASPNEFEPFTFTVRPLKDLGTTEVALSDLKNGEHTLPASNIELFFIKYFPQQVGNQGDYEPIPTHVYPYQDMVLKKDWNRQYWANVWVPKGAAAGTYTGTISVTPEHGAATTIPITLRVRGFELPGNQAENGMWNNNAFGSHMLNAFPEHKAYAEQVLAAELKNWADHGMNGFVLGAPKAEYDRENVKVTLNFERMDQIAAACKKAGMRGRHLMASVPGLIQYGLMRRGFKEFSPEFTDAYIQILTQVRDWLVKNEVRAVVQIFDEPREKELNDWNRNRKDTLWYLRHASRIENMDTMVTLMGDRDAFGRPYTPLVPMMDVCATHPWERSDDQIFLCSVEKMAELWLYNGGASRLTHGFYLWKTGALGHWQWVYSWEVRDAHLPVVHAKATSLGYAVPGGFINKIDFEFVREGVDDHRYLLLLEKKLATAAQDDATAIKARGFLKTVRDFLPQYPKDHGLSTGAEAGGKYNESEKHYYFGPWREQVAEYIVALNEKRAPKKIEAAWSMFPKQLAAEKKQVVCQLIAPAGAPKIDGDGSDEAWAAAEPTTGFVNLARGQMAPIQTFVKTMCDGERLYFRFTCDEPKYGELKAYAIERDQGVWQDDSIEIFLDDNADKKTYKHLIVNCLGTIQDADGRDGLFNADVKAAVKKSKGAWTVELSVTLKSLGVTAPAEGATWGVNLCRNRKPDPSETSSWAWVGHSFHNPEGFGEMVFKK